MWLWIEFVEREKKGDRRYRDVFGSIVDHSQPPTVKTVGLRDSGPATQGLTTPLGGEEDADE